jgi:hypothetical protein
MYILNLHFYIADRKTKDYDLDGSKHSSNSKSLFVSQGHLTDKYLHLEEDIGKCRSQWRTHAGKWRIANSPRDREGKMLGDLKEGGSITTET